MLQLIQLFQSVHVLVLSVALAHQLLLLQLHHLHQLLLLQ
jgi:hypothetical protein